LNYVQTKLTLRMESELIERAKQHAKQQGKSLSQVVADYFAVYTQDKDKKNTAPVTKSLVGVFKESGLDQESYKKHLEEKYL